MYPFPASFVYGTSERRIDRPWRTPMTRNENTIDRVIRLVIAVAAVAGAVAVGVGTVWEHRPVGGGGGDGGHGGGGILPAVPTVRNQHLQGPQLDVRSAQRSRQGSRASDGIANLGYGQGSDGGRTPAAIPGLFRYAATITDNSDTAEDLVSETLVKALERCRSFRGDSGLSTWLHRILHNLAVDHFRRASREVPADDIASQVEAKWREDDYTVDAAAVVGRRKPGRSSSMHWCICR